MQESVISGCKQACEKKKKLQELASKHVNCVDQFLRKLYLLKFSVVRYEYEMVL